MKFPDRGGKETFFRRKALLIALVISVTLTGCSAQAQGKDSKSPNGQKFEQVESIKTPFSIPIASGDSITTVAKRAIEDFCPQMGIDPNDIRSISLTFTPPKGNKETLTLDLSDKEMHWATVLANLLEGRDKPTLKNGQTVQVLVYH